jgi:hypothetical protein
MNSVQNNSRGFSRALAIPALVLFLFASAGTLTAQEGGPVFRRLRWDPVEYASGYEVAVELLTASNEWVEQFRKTGITETFVDCPLFVGKYRFRVSALDLLGRPGPAAEWIYFELRARETEKAEAPEIPEPLRPERQAPPEEQTPPGAIAEPLPEETLFSLELLYAPLITLTFSNFNDIYATAPFQPVGFVVRFTVHPLKDPHWGFGLEPSWNFLSSEIHDKSRYTHVGVGHLFVVRLFRPGWRDLYINIRAGGGISCISSRFDFNSGLDIDRRISWNPSASISVSLQSRISGSLFLDAGIEYFHIFSRDNALLNYLKPTIGLAWRF